MNIHNCYNFKVAKQAVLVVVFVSPAAADADVVDIVVNNPAWQGRPRFHPMQSSEICMSSKDVAYHQTTYSFLFCLGGRRELLITSSAFQLNR